MCLAASRGNVPRVKIFRSDFSWLIPKPSAKLVCMYWIPYAQIREGHELFQSVRKYFV